MLFKTEETHADSDSVWAVTGGRNSDWIEFAAWISNIT